MFGLTNLNGRTLGQYELRALLGVGGMGAVYRANQPSLNRDVAIKLLPPELTHDDASAKRFNQEAHVSAWLEHAHIVPIYDYGTVEGINFIVMRLLTGGSLQDRIDYSLESGRDFPTSAEIIDVLRQLAGALDYAHNLDVIHRDIKPSNVMFDSVGAAFLVDFGVARMLEQNTGRLTRTGMAVGTAPYMAPEQFLNEEPTPAVDQYAMGVMTFALLTGKVPYQASNLPALANMHVNDPIPSIKDLRPDLSSDVDTVFQKVLAKRPEDRYPSVSAFVNALESALANTEAGIAAKTPTGFFLTPIPGQQMAQPTPSSQPSPFHQSDSSVPRTDPTLVDLPSDTGAVSQVLPARSRRGGIAVTVAVFGLMAIIAGVIGFAIAESQQDPPGGLLVAMGMVPGWTETPTETATLTVTVTPTESPTSTETDVPTATPTATEATTVTQTATATDVEASMATVVSTPTVTPQATSTSVPSETPTETPTATIDIIGTTTTEAVALAAQQADLTPSPAPTWTSTTQPTETETATETVTATWTPTVTLTLTETPTSTETPSATSTDAVTLTQTESLTPTETSTSTETATSRASVTSTAILTITPTPIQTLVSDLSDTQIQVSITDAGEPSTEYLKLQNLGDTVNMMGWTLTDLDGNTYTFPEMLFLSGTTIMMHSEDGENTATDIFWGMDESVFEPDGDILWLIDSSGNEQIIHYGDATVPNCEIIVEQTNIPVRVGPDTDRTIRKWAPTHETIVVSGQYEEDDGSIWYRIIWPEDPDNNRYWLLSDDAQAEPLCEFVGNASPSDFVQFVPSSSQSFADESSTDADSCNPGEWAAGCGANGCELSESAQCNEQGTSWVCIPNPARCGNGIVLPETGSPGCIFTESDWISFQACYLQPTVTSECERWDFNSDGIVNLGDFSIFASKFCGHDS